MLGRLELGADRRDVPTDGTSLSVQQTCALGRRTLTAPNTLELRRKQTPRVVPRVCSLPCTLARLEPIFGPGCKSTKTAAALSRLVQRAGCGGRAVCADWGGSTRVSDPALRQPGGPAYPYRACVGGLHTAGRGRLQKLQRVAQRPSQFLAKPDVTPRRCLVRGAALVQHSGLAQRRERLVRALDHHVRSRLQGGVEPQEGQVRAVGFVHQQRYTVLVAHR